MKIGFVKDENETSMTYPELIALYLTFIYNFAFYPFPQNNLHRCDRTGRDCRTSSCTASGNSDSLNIHSHRWIESNNRSYILVFPWHTDRWRCRPGWSRAGLPLSGRLCRWDLKKNRIFEAMKNLNILESREMSFATGQTKNHYWKIWARRRQPLKSADRLKSLPLQRCTPNWSAPCSLLYSQRVRSDTTYEWRNEWTNKWILAGFGNYHSSWI